MTFPSSFTLQAKMRISLKAELVEEASSQGNPSFFSFIKDEILACSIKRRLLAFQLALILDVLLHRLELWFLL